MFYSASRYDWMFAFAMFMSWCVDVMSSAYFVSFTCACGVGVSDVYMMNNVGVVLMFCF